MKMIFLLAIFCFAFAVVLEAQAKNPPTVAEAEQFMNQAEAKLAELSVKATRRTGCTKISSLTTVKLSPPPLTMSKPRLRRTGGAGKRFDGLKLPPELARKFLLLKLQLMAPAPKDPKLRKEITQIAVSLESDYGKGKY